MIVVTSESITLHKNVGGLSENWGLEPLSPIAGAATEPHRCLWCDQNMHSTWCKCD